MFTFYDLFWSLLWWCAPPQWSKQSQIDKIKPYVFLLWEAASLVYTVYVIIEKKTALSTISSHSFLSAINTSKIDQQAMERAKSQLYIFYIILIDNQLHSDMSNNLSQKNSFPLRNCSLTNSLCSPNKLCILSQNICVLLQNYYVPLINFVFAHKRTEIHCFQYFCKTTQIFCEWTQSFSAECKRFARECKSSEI